MKRTSVVFLFLALLCLFNVIKNFSGKHFGSEGNFITLSSFGNLDNFIHTDTRLKDIDEVEKDQFWGFIFDIICIFVLICYNIYYKIISFKLVHKTNNLNITTSDYALRIDNIPQDMNEQEIREWIETLTYNDSDGFQ